MQSKINLRVYRRTQDNIVLLWDTNYLTEEQKQNPKLFLVKNNIETPLVFNDSSEIEGEIDGQLRDATVVAIVNHRKNNLSPFEDYKIKLILGDISSVTKVYAYGVLPNSEKDKKQQNVHLMAWDEKNRCWRKVTGIQTKEGFAILIKQAK